MVGVVFIIILRRLLPEPRTFYLAVVIAVAVIYLVGVWSAGGAEKYFGVVDPGPVVIDEVVGMLITLAFIPVGWSAALAGFFLFRVFDVFKPYPAGRFEQLHGGLGVMADDAMAAVYANLVLRAAVWGWARLIM